MLARRPVWSRLCEHLCLAACLCGVLVAGCRREKAASPTRLLPTPPHAASTLIVSVSPTPVPDATTTPTPTMTPTLRPSATLKAQPTATRSPSPTHTPPLAQRYQAVQRVADDGDYAEAIALWEDARRITANPPAGLRVTMAQAYLAERRPADGIALLVNVVTSTGTTLESTTALGLLANAYRDLGEWQAQIGALERCLEREPEAGAALRWRLAKAYEGLGAHAEAAQQLEAIDLSALTAAQVAEILEELATVRRKQKDYAAALSAYERILAFAARAEYRATIQLREAETQREAGSTEKAKQICQALLAQYPESSVAYAALRLADELGPVAITDLQRAEILIRAGQYALSVQALQRHLQTRDDELGRAHYRMGFAYERAKDMASAFTHYDVVIEQYPQDASVGDAWMAKARAAAAMGGDATGIYHEFARLYPTHARAPEALWLAAVALERADDWARAGEYYHRLATEYPTDRRAQEAVFREGLSYYAQRKWSQARTTWQGVQQANPAGDERARQLVWLGLASAAAGDAQGAKANWKEAANASALGYYGQRARDLLAEREPVFKGKYTLALPREVDGDESYLEIARWVEGWSPSAAIVASTEGTSAVRPTIDPQQTLANVNGRSAARRAAALSRLGWQDEAQASLRDLRDQVWGDARGLAATILIAQELELPAVVNACAERLLTLGGSAKAPAPLVLQRLAYPLTFSQYVLAETKGQPIDPLLFLALMRQESRFDARAVSYAGARGLAQVMPDTGKWIASRLGLSDYRDDWLFRPAISVRFGVYYLEQTLQDYGGDWVAALVAYNAGPGALQSWSGGHINDHDLFVETVPISQTQSYIKRIYEQYRLYEAIYRAR